jgi:hypothetical protein
VDFRGYVVSPDAVEVQQPGEREREHDERNHRREDLKRDRARGGQEVMLLESVEQRVPELARSRPNL